MSYDAPMIALTDIVRDTGARDGALADVRGTDIHVASTLRHEISRRLIDARGSRELAQVLAEGTPRWLDPAGVAALYLPVGTAVLAIPFPPSGARRVAFLAYDAPVALSWADLHFFQRALSMTLDQPGLPMAA